MKHAIEPGSAAERYFETLPLNVQETLKQTGVCFRSENELRACAAQLLGEQPPQTNGQTT